MNSRLNRREMLGVLTSAALCGRIRAASAPTAPVAAARCPSYGAELLPALEKMFDQLGGVGRLVRGKTVAIKLNLTGSPWQRFGYAPIGDSHWVNPHVVGAVVHLFGRAGAQRIRLLESPWCTTEPLEEYMLAGEWDPQDFLSAAPKVEFENTNYLGRATKYTRLPVPNGGIMFNAFDLNHSYADCDVFVSLTKLKEHINAGMTGSMKNCFGLTPCTIYGVGAGEDEPGEVPLGGRTPLHVGNRQPSKSSLPENDPSSPREAGYRLPRIVADLVAARPVHLGIVEGVRAMTGGEGPWASGRRRKCELVNPGVLIAGTNPVTTDAVCAAVMGFDPMADRGTPPFELADSTMRFGEQHGIGTRDISRIEVIGTPIRDVRFDYRAHSKLLV